MQVRNPRTGAYDYSITPPTPDELSALAARARDAQSDWEHAGLGARTEVLLAWREALLARRAQIVTALVTDTGRLIESELELDAICGSIERWCRIAPPLLAEEDAKQASIPIFSVRQAMRPYQLVGVISPWNFPLLLSLIDAIPALIAGCSVLIKPSEIAPRFIEPVAAAIADVPALAGVVTYITGAAQTGQALIEACDVICFTGSVPTGMSVAQQAAQRFIPAFLELGGKDPAIVLSGADIDRSTSAILWGGTANAGQSCLSIERVYVQRDIHDDFVESLSRKARTVALAIPTPADGRLGPIIADKQIPVIASHLDDASAKGAKARTGGALETHDGGVYCPATVLTDVDHTMKVMTEETFGPILPVMAFDTVDEAVELANATIYGLSGAVFAATTEEAMPVAQRVRAGALSINDAALTALIYDGEKNSFNRSGMGGSRMGPAALRRFGRRQAYLIADTPAPDPWWYPPE